MLKFTQSGQAVIEYLLIFLLMSVITIGMLKGSTTVMSTGVGRIAYILSKHLSVAVCPRYCLMDSFNNKLPPSP